MKVGLGIGVCQAVTASGGGAGGTDFIMSYDTSVTGTTGANTFRVTLRAGQTYDFTYSTEDGESGTITSSSNFDITHAVDGVHTITISTTDDGAGFPGFYYNNTNDDLKITDISQWGNAQWSASMIGAFAGCSNMDITAEDAPDLSSVTNMTSSFLNCTSMTADPVWDFSNVQLMVGTFSNTGISGAVGSKDFSAATTLSPFTLCDSITSLGTWTTTTALTSLSGAYNGMNGITTSNTISVTSAVTNFNNMFLNAGHTTSGMTVVALDTSAATSMDSMFEGSYANNIPTLDYTNVLTLYQFAYQTKKLTTMPNISAPVCTDANSFLYLSSVIATCGDLNLPLVTTCANLCRDRGTLTSMGTLTIGTACTNLSRAFASTGITTPVVIAGDSSGVTDWTQFCYLANGLDGTAVPAYDMSGMTIGGNCFTGVDFTTTSYSNLLIDIEANNTDLDCNFHGGDSQYNAAGETARDALTGRTPGWTITDGGLEP